MMSYTYEEAIRVIKERLSIVDVVQADIRLRRSGRKWLGLCPFHNDHHPSLSIYENNNRFICFTCGEQGDIFDWYGKFHQADFTIALQALAERAGVELPDQPPANPQLQAARTALEQQHEFYQMSLRGAEGRQARLYIVRERGITKEMALTFGLGYAPQQPSDPFRGRLIVPLHDELGQLVGFSGRTLTKQKPKYLNSPQSEIFNKGKILYNLHRAKTSVRKTGTLILMEGYTDVILATQYGIPNCVATMGTALTEHHVSMLVKTKAKLVLCLDGDAAGQVATRRGIARLNEIPGIVPALYIAALPPDMDPGDLVRQDTARFKYCIEQAKPVISWLVATISIAPDMDGKERSAVVQEIIPLIRNIADPIEQDFYCQEVAQAIGASTEAVRMAVLTRQRKRTVATSTIAEPVNPNPPENPAERLLLGLLLSQPQWAMPLMPEVAKLIFGQEDNEILRKDFCACFAAGTSGQSAKDALQTLSDTPGRTELLQDLVQYATTGPYSPGQDKTLWSTLVRDLLKRLHLQQAQRQQAVLTAAIQQASKAGDTEKVTQLVTELQHIAPHLRPPTSTMFPNFSSS